VKWEEGEGEVPEGIKGHSATEKNGANSKVSKPWQVRTYEFCAQAAELVSHKCFPMILPCMFVFRTVIVNC
jgi:hypothetical protein